MFPHIAHHATYGVRVQAHQIFVLVVRVLHSLQPLPLRVKDFLKYAQNVVRVLAALQIV